MRREVIKRVGAAATGFKGQKVQTSVFIGDQFDCGIPDPTILPVNPGGLEMASPDGGSADETLVLPSSLSAGGQVPLPR